VCLGLPGRVVTVGADHPDLATVELGGRLRTVNIGLLDAPVRPGEWVLVHLGFALSTMSEREATDAVQALADERIAEWGTQLSVPPEPTGQV
jgi:hydrogenase expression/formation protein HypC